jgi:hypothetical protein
MPRSAWTAFYASLYGECSVRNGDGIVELFEKVVNPAAKADSVRGRIRAQVSESAVNRK